MCILMYVVNCYSSNRKRTHRALNTEKTALKKECYNKMTSTYNYINICTYKIYINYINIATYISYCQILLPYVFYHFFPKCSREPMNAREGLFSQDLSTECSSVSWGFSNFWLKWSTLVFCITYLYLLIYISSLDDKNTFQWCFRWDLFIGKHPSFERLEILIISKWRLVI